MINEDKKDNNSLISEEKSLNEINKSEENSKIQGENSKNILTKTSDIQIEEDKMKPEVQRLNDLDENLQKVLKARFLEVMDPTTKTISLDQMNKILTENGIDFKKTQEAMKENSLSENDITYENLRSLIILTYAKKPDVNMYDTKIPNEILNYTQGGGIKIEIDKNIVEQMKQIDEKRAQAEKEGNYTLASTMREKYDEIRKKETQKILEYINDTQKKEYDAIEKAQKTQFREFQIAWEKYIKDYEESAKNSLENFKERNKLDIDDFRKRQYNELKIRMKFSKKVLELRKKEEALLKLREYAEATKIKNKIDKLEAKEKTEIEAKLIEKIGKREKSLKSMQENTLAALMKRIQRDKDEHAKQMQLDSQRLSQRNKNLLHDLQLKHQFEIKKANDFLRATFSSLPQLKTQSPIRIKNPITNQ